MEVDGSHCLRIASTITSPNWRNSSYDYEDKILTLAKAKSECSENKRCVGIEYMGDKYNDDDTAHFRICLDAIYSSTAWDKYEDFTGKLLKKDENYGKFAL